MYDKMSFIFIEFYSILNKIFSRNKDRILILPGSFWVVFVKAVPPELVLMGGDGKEISVGREQSTRGEIKGILGCSRD